MAEKIGFEEAMKKLETIVTELEQGEVSLDKSLKMFEEGIRLSRVCAERLEETQKKIEMLVKDKDGELTRVTFNLSAEDKKAGHE